MIDGWRRAFSDKFTIPAGAATVKFTLQANGSNVYFDDFRFHPFDAQVQTFVYNYNKSRLSATLDENNYATFYEYDDAGNLVRLKKETEKGIRTIKETRSYIPSQQNQ